MDKNMLTKLKKHKTILKSSVALLLLWYIFKNIDIMDTYLVVRNANLYLLGGAFLLAIFNQIFLSNFKWSIMLKAYNAAIPFRELYKMYLTGMFFSMFLPGSYGGDIVRAYRVSKRMGNGVDGVMSVVIERATGLMGLLAILLTALFLVDQSVITYNLRVSIIGSILISVAGFFLLFSRRLMERLSFLFALAGKNNEARIREVCESLYALKKKKVALLVAFISVLFQFLVVLTNYMIALSIDVHIPFSYLLLTIPVISLLSMVPVTLNGIGVRDVSYIGFLGAIGVEKESAFSIGLIAFFMGIMMSLYGGLIYMREK